MKAKKWEEAALYFNTANNNDYHFYTQERLAPLLNNARSSVTEGNKELTNKAYSIVPDKKGFTGDDYFNYAESVVGSKYSRSSYFRDAYRKYESEGVSLGKNYEKAQKYAKYYENMKEGYNLYGGKWPLLQIDDRLKKKQMPKSNIWPAYQDQMQKLYFSYDGTVDTYSKSYGPYQWEYEDGELLISYYDKKSKTWKKTGAINSQGYLCINGVIINSKMSPVMFLNYKDCLDKYTTDYLLNIALQNKELYKVEKGIYSDSPDWSAFALISFKHKNIVFTMHSAFFYQGVTSCVPEKFCIGTERNTAKIKAPTVKQFFYPEEPLQLGIEKKL